MLNLIDAFTREALAIRVAQAQPVGRARGAGRADAGAGHTVADPIRHWPRIRRRGGDGVAWEPRRDHRPHRAGRPWENGSVERFNARFRDELLDGEIFSSPKEAQILIEAWRRRDNTVRPHSAF